MDRRVLAPSTAVSHERGQGSLATYGTGNTTRRQGLAKASSSSPAYYDPYLAGRAPECGNWNFGIQREITRDMSINISYVGSEGHLIAPAATSTIDEAVGARNGLLSRGRCACRL